MKTRNSSKFAIKSVKLSPSDATDLIWSSDESEVERLQAKYATICSNTAETKALPESTLKAKGKRGKRGILEKMSALPLDVVLEIYSYLEPLDVLRLSRTSKAMRAFLMSQSNGIVWRTARLNVPDLPPLPSDLSEPQYANLAFDSYCHPCENVIWQCRVRCCNKCFNTAFYSRPNLHSVWNRSYALTFMVFNKLAQHIPYVSVTPWKGPWDGEDKVYFPPNIQTLRHGYRRVRKDEFLVEDWIRRTEQQHVEIMEHAAACSRWQKANNDSRSKELQNTRSRRKAAIYEKLRQLGWGDEIDRLESENSSLLSAHKSVRQAKDLTDKVNPSAPRIKHINSDQMSAG
ncbi:hypothetical protein BT96DRAFT_989539 [Gymnopus androsaceus JB14]|uniref:F-box domain-containing protein n=1 Tax=Gymnopus androsaceus JB14 TaxID=1447944 RepID=A0A6A4I640_9AGAR|nr:hypothetical protein BT96DRAFT_989539 [Gymnopus androsaceus JB14]